MAQKSIRLEEAREILGATGKKMTDEEIIKLLDNLYGIISHILDNNSNLFENAKSNNLLSG